MATVLIGNGAPALHIRVHGPGTGRFAKLIDGLVVSGRGGQAVVDAEVWQQWLRENADSPLLPFLTWRVQEGETHV